MLKLGVLRGCVAGHSRRLEEFSSGSGFAEEARSREVLKLCTDWPRADPVQL